MLLLLTAQKAPSLKIQIWPASLVNFLAKTVKLIKKHVLLVSQAIYTMIINVKKVVQILCIKMVIFALIVWPHVSLAQAQLIVKVVMEIILLEQVV